MQKINKVTIWGLIFVAFGLGLFWQKGVSADEGLLDVRIPIGDTTDREIWGDSEERTVKGKDGKEYTETIYKMKYDANESNSLLGNYTKLIYGYLKGIVATLAAVMIVWGGVEWTMSGGNQESISSGKEKIISALIGLGLFIVAGLLLQTINPDLFGTT